MVSLKKERPLQARSKVDLAAVDLAFVNHVRFVAMDCRSKRREDIFKACALLHASRTVSSAAYADALARCLADAIGKRVTFHTPGTAELSFDESWLLQLGKAIKREDEASTAFLLASRVSREHSRLVRFLVGRIALQFL